MEPISIVAAKTEQEGYIQKKIAKSENAMYVCVHPGMMAKISAGGECRMIKIVADTIV